MKNSMEYPFEIRPLTKEEGGGWLITYPDLPGCMSDGETPEEAVTNGRDALTAWLMAMEEAGREAPQPGSESQGNFTTSIPRSLQSKLFARAEKEGVSVNALVSAFLTDSLARREMMQP